MNPLTALWKSLWVSIELSKTLNLCQLLKLWQKKLLLLRPTRSPERAISLIRQRKITNLLIVDDDKKLLGIVSAYDLIKKLDGIKTIDEIMIPAVPFLLDTATAKDAIIMMDDCTIRHDSYCR